MSDHRKEEEQKELEEKEGHFDEPPLEAFLEDEETEEIKQKRHKKKRFLFGSIAVILSLGLLFQVFAVWFNWFNLDSIQLRQASEALSEDEIVVHSKEAVVLIQNGPGRGTGFIIDEDGYIITNEHVVNQRDPISVHFQDGSAYVAEVIESDVNLDIALLKIEASDLPSLSLSTEELQVEDSIYVIGNPLLQMQIANQGEVLEKGERFNVLRISNSIYPGHSGSPVLNEQGEVIGVVYARTNPTHSQGDQSVGLAVPMEFIVNDMCHIRQFIDESTEWE
ncbi:S1C family serine protease [Alkalihalobacillus pseudalcaliphilus]|uniref:S1C family serine protease n=1 Tax=Alkalihalobacillus pseudalcaliphilus TaxID=79884 RepID=UPI00064DCD47|nr:serine protease [Alkalihalobacillus pseudalcaliphilus]KMK76515.1 hypothetical protein AB990_15165 [Alkalihalobacillus pseudalcaliphilus]